MCIEEEKMFISDEAVKKYGESYFEKWLLKILEQWRTIRLLSLKMACYCQETICIIYTYHQMKTMNRSLKLEIFKENELINRKAEYDIEYFVEAFWFWMASFLCILKKCHASSVPGMDWWVSLKGNTQIMNKNKISQEQALLLRNSWLILDHEW